MGTLWNRLYWKLTGRQKNSRNNSRVCEPTGRLRQDAAGCNLKPHDGPWASQCWAVPLDYLQGRSCFPPAKSHVQYPQIVSVVPTALRRWTPWEDKSRNTVISSLAVRKQESVLSYSPSHEMCYFQFSQSMSHNLCLIPRKQQLPKHQPVSWIKAFRNSGANLFLLPLN